MAFDKALFGNAFLEAATDAQGSFLALFHQDASRCRVARDDRHAILHHDWAAYDARRARQLPLYPLFEPAEDGTLRRLIHYKDYEPMFEHYGLPSYIAGMNVSAIAYKTDRWNISRLDNSFQLSGVMVLDGEGDWKLLHEQATSDIVVAHSWFRSLSGLDYSTGFSAERILHEYEIALNTLILGEQQELLEPVRRLIETRLGCDASSLQIVNRPPTRSKPLYMKVWEARKCDGLSYDPQDPEQNLYLAQITKYAMRSID